MSGKFDLADYVDVKERVRLFYERHPEGRLCTGEVRVTREPDDVPRVWVQALAYRDPADIHPGVGWSWMLLPGTTPYTRGSEIENVETSAWGRAIGALGIGIAKSIASADEVRAKGGAEDKVEHSDDGGLVGTAEAGDKASSDFSLRMTPKGPVLGFRLRGGRGGILVRCAGDLAEQLAAFRDATVGQRVTVWGAITEESFTPRGKSESVTYQVLAAERVRVPEVGDLPTRTPEPEPGVVGLSEAESEALWNEIDRVGA